MGLGRFELELARNLILISPGRSGSISMAVGGGGGAGKELRM